jgi:hypothetical protein
MVGETMMQVTDWREHVREAERLLALSQAPKGDRTNAISYLYKAVVQITVALNKLETRDDV